jgi:hypothetical protein
VSDQERDIALETEIMAFIVARAVKRRFDAMVGGPLLTSPLVFEAVREVMLTIFGPTENSLQALDEIEKLEAALQEVMRPTDRNRS